MSPTADSRQIRENPAGCGQPLASTGGDSLPSRCSEASTLDTALRGLGEVFLENLPFEQQGAHSLDDRSESPLVTSALNTMTMSLAFMSMEEKAQTRQQRIAAHEQYRTTIKSIQHGMKGFTFSDLPDGTSSLCLAVYLIAIFEMAVSSPGHGADTAWREHLAGLQSMMNYGQSVSPRVRSGLGNSESCSFARSVDLALRRLQVLSPALDDALDHLSSPRDLDVRKLRIETRKVHRALVMAKSVQDRALHACDSDCHTAANSRARTLTLSSCLLVTTDFLERSAAYLRRRKGGCGEGSVERASLRAMRRASIACVVAECARVLDVNLGRPNTPTWAASGSAEVRLGRAPTLIDGLLVLFPLCLVLGMVETNGSQYCLIREMLALVAEKCCIPRAIQVLCDGDIRHMKSAEVIDGLVLLSMGSR